MNNVIRLDEARPHLCGPARCLRCKHEWTAVGPVGEWCLTCPSCGLDTGVRAALCMPDGVNAWTCNCGNWFFVLLHDGTICPNCGSRQSFGES